MRNITDFQKISQKSSAQQATLAMQSTKIEINFPIAAIKTKNSFLFFKKNAKRGI